jgi:plastocyanin
VPVRGAGRARRAAVVLGTIAVASVAVVPASHAGKSDKPIKGPTIEVADDFFSPTDISVKSNTKVKYKWNPANLDQHNVVLSTGPKKVDKKEFKSATGTIGIKFAPVFEKKGAYDFVCTIHPDVMKMKVTVKK